MAVKSLLFGAAASLVMASAAAAQTHQFDIPAQDAVTALQAFAQQSGKQVLFPFDAAAGHRTPAIKGDLPDSRALQMLLDAANMVIVQDDGRTITLRGHRKEDGAMNGAPARADEIVVTGSHIRGVPPIAPVQMITRADIEESGQSQISQLMLSQPAFFGGGQNPTAQLTGTLGVGGTNFSNAATVDLHGLGADATLTLLNGHRLAADSYFQAADISGIPLDAVERVDIITDGASALYGSDAVGGVVNFVLRKDYDGAEVSSTIGGATRGGGFEQDYNIVAGKAWGSGHALVSAQYFSQDPIYAYERSFTSDPSLANSLLWNTSHYSVFFSGAQNITSWATFDLDALYSQRRAGSITQYVPGGEEYYTSVPTSQYQINPSLDIHLPHGWLASIDGSVSRSSDIQNIYYTGFSGSDVFINNVNSVELNASGTALKLPGGDLKLALGGGYRNESFTTYAPYLGASQNQFASRGVSYVFGEVFAPLVAPSTDRVGLEKLDLSLAGRAEHYTDFGDTANPKVALRYQPFSGVSLRSTWGTSFKAPTFEQLSQPNDAVLYPASEAGGTGPGYALFNGNGNPSHPNLKPEKATSWTIGVDYTPIFHPSLDVSATYFNIVYRDRIVSPISVFSQALSNPLYAPFVTKNATPAQIAAFEADTVAFFNATGAPYDPSLPTALVQDVYVNAARQNIQGVDLSARDSVNIPLGQMKLFASATWLDISQKTLPGEPNVTLTGTIFSPARFRFRSGATWIYQGLAATGVINYVSGETDTSVTPSQTISSWTTFDLTVAYNVPVHQGLLSGIETSLSVTNLFDAAPPYAAGAAVSIPGIHFDSTNVSPIGRFVALTVRKRF